MLDNILIDTCKSCGHSCHHDKQHLGCHCEECVCSPSDPKEDALSATFENEVNQYDRNK